MTRAQRMGIRIAIVLLGAAAISAVRKQAPEAAIGNSNAIHIPPVEVYRRYVVVESFESPVYTKMSDAFTRHARGDVHSFVLDEEKRLRAEDLAFIREVDADAIIALGTSAAELLGSIGLDAPVIAVAVSSRPKARGVKAGVLSVASQSDGIDSVLALAPATKRIGVLEHVSKGSAFVEELRRAAESRGLDLHTAAATTPESALAALPRLFETSDVVYLNPEISFHTAELEALAAKLSLERRVPVAGFKSSQCAIGALVTTELDSDMIGAQAARLAQMIAIEGKVPRDPFPPAIITKLHVNPKVANQIGIAIPTHVALVTESCTEAE